MRRRTGTLKRSLLTLVLGLGLANPAAAAVASELEAKVMAAYVYHLIKFVEWPALPTDSFRICVQGAGPVGGLLNELSHRTVRERTLKVETDGDVARCQVLFISRNDRLQPDLLVKARRLGVLTISDHEEFARRGGVVGFYSEAGKIRLEINPEAARASNLRVSAKLLELARTVPASRE